jgi:hypothetical protein
MDAQVSTKRPFGKQESMPKPHLSRRIFARGGYFEWALMVAKARRWLNLFMES